MMIMGRRIRHLGPIEPIPTTTTTTTAASETTTPTTSALLKESRQLLLKQQLKLQLNINVSEMMDNLRRNVDDDCIFTQKFDGDLSQNLARVQGEINDIADSARARLTGAEASRTMGTAAEDGQNKLDTVTTVPQLQQKFNKFNIIEEAAASTSAATTTSTTLVRTTTTTTNKTTASLHVEDVITTTATLSSTYETTTTNTTFTTAALTYTSLTQKQPENTALAKFNRIIDNTVPVLGHYQQQQQQQQVQKQQHQHVADTFSKASQPTLSSLEMPLLSDSLKRRLATHPYYKQTDLIVNNSQLISSIDRTGTATTTSAVGASAPLPPLTSSHNSPHQREKREKDEEEMEQVFVEDDQLKRNDVHYLLKQLNSFSDIEEIEIVDMKQKQRLQQQLIRDKQQQQLQQHQHYHHNHHQQQQQQQLHQHQQQQQQPHQLLHTHDQQNVYSLTESTRTSCDSQQSHTFHQHAEATNRNLQHVALRGQHISQNVTTEMQQHVTTTLPLYVSSYSQHISNVAQQHINPEFVHLPPPLYRDSVNYGQQQRADNDNINDNDEENDDNDDDDDDDVTAVAAIESKQYFQATSLASSPTATSLVIYSPSSQSHKGIRRYASLHHQPGDSLDYRQQHQQHLHCHRYNHTQSQNHHQAPGSHCPPYYHHGHMHMPHEHYSEGSILDSAAARAAACDPLALQQFVDDYIFQSCHYLETNNFAANYCTAMVESSSHEFRPSTTTTTRTSNEEYDDEECYVEDHSSAHSFELHECEPPTVICKAPAPAPAPQPQHVPQHIRASMRHLAPLTSPPPQYTMETRLCSSGVQTDLTASSLAQSFSLSSSLSSTEQRKRRQPIFKCCYTPLDRWREKRHHQHQQHKQQQQEEKLQQQQLQLTKQRTKTVTEQSSSSRTTITSCLKKTTTTTTAVVDTTGDAGGGVNILVASGTQGGGHTTSLADTGSNSASVVVVHSQHHSLSTKNAPYAV